MWPRVSLSIQQTTSASDSERSKQQSYVRVTAALQLEEAAVASPSGPTHPTPRADVRVDVEWVCILIGYHRVRSSCLQLPLLPLPCQSLFHSSKVRAAVFVTDDVCLSQVKPEIGGIGFTLVPITLLHYNTMCTHHFHGATLQKGLIVKASTSSSGMLCHQNRVVWTAATLSFLLKSVPFRWLQINLDKHRQTFFNASIHLDHDKTGFLPILQKVCCICTMKTSDDWIGLEKAFDSWETEKCVECHRQRSLLSSMKL